MLQSDEKIHPFYSTVDTVLYFFSALEGMCKNLTAASC